MSLLRILDESTKPALVTAYAMRRLLRSPWCYPIQESRQKLLEGWGFPLAEEGLTGEALLVTAPETEVGSGAIWHLAADERHGNARPFKEPIEESYERAMQLASKALSYVFRPELIEAPPRRWFAIPLNMADRTPDQSTGGDSFQLPMALAAASFLLDIPLPTDIVATGSIDNLGNIAKVSGIVSKVGAIVDNALGVRRMLVPRDNAEEAAAAVERSRRRGELAIIPFNDLRSVVSYIFPDTVVAKHYQERWSARPGELNRFAQTLFATAYPRTGKGTRISSWSGVRAAARLALDQLPSETGEFRNRAELACEVAARHAGGVALPVSLGSWAYDADRKAQLAQSIQAMTDSPRDPIPTAEASLKSLPLDDKNLSIEELMVLGACARAYGAMRQYAKAEDLASRACVNWIGLRWPSDSAHAFCELIRVLGVRSRETDLRKWIDWGIDNGVVREPGNATFVACAIAQALLLCGNAEAAGEFLEDPVHGWHRAPPWLGYHRCRLQAAICDTRKESEKAAKLRQSINDGLCSSPDDDYLVFLTQLDFGLVRSTWKAPLDNLLKLADDRPNWGFEVKRLYQLLIDDGFTGHALASAFAREFRY